MAKDRDLEIEQDERFQKKSWRYQKIGIVIILLLILTALTGLLGSGPLSFKKTSGENISIEYPAITRFSHPEEIKITVTKSKKSTIDLIINRDYLSDINIERITPQPLEEKVYKDFIQFSFAANGEDMNIMFNLQFRSSGIKKGEWGIKNESILKISHFVFP